ncbi:MAG: hypothetical protein HKN23_09815, partial [Verrucomicrobiales bacterium]|nr:hypothetical protein [Verrucomicrobiales bacterium]
MHLLAAAGFFSGFGLAADLDSLEHSHRDTNPVPVRWELCRPVAANPGQFPRPFQSLIPRRRLTQLAPGEEIRIWIAAGSSLRLSGDLAPGDVRLGVSNGSGLYVETEMAVGPEGKNLFYHSFSNTAVLARIQRPAEFEMPTEFVAATSKLDRHPDYVTYREILEPENGGAVQVRTDDELESSKFWLFGRGQPIDWIAEGGPESRIRFEGRLRYSPLESELVQPFRVRVLDRDRGDREIATLEFVSSAETTRVVLIDGRESVVSRLETGYFELPENRPYRLRLVSTASLVGRVAVRGKEYL